MASKPRAPSSIYQDINERYFDNALPEVEFRWVEDFSEGEGIDTRSDTACVFIATPEGARWRNELRPHDKLAIEINSALRGFSKILAHVVAHEMIHIKHPGSRHGSREWNSEVRRLQGLGFFLRNF